MYKINKTVVLNGSSVSPSQAYSSSEKNIEFEKKAHAKAGDPEPFTQESVYNLAKAVSSQKNYQVELWDNLSTGAAPISLFTALRSAWQDRKN